jgi:hypothetical protein
VAATGASTLVVDGQADVGSWWGDGGQLWLAKAAVVDGQADVGSWWGDRGQLSLAEAVVVDGRAGIGSWWGDGGWLLLAKAALDGECGAVVLDTSVAGSSICMATVGAEFTGSVPRKYQELDIPCDMGVTGLEATAGALVGDWMPDMEG